MSTVLPTTTDEIRERYLEFFESREHLRLPSASLVPPPDDRTVLLTTAGMQPLKPYFLGREPPPAPRLTSCQKCFRTPDIDKVGLTKRHLTFFEMLGNFSIGAYFKEGAIQLAWTLSLEVFGFDPDDIWVTVFAGDPELDLGPDEDAVELWQAVGVPRERIVQCPRSENFWEAGPVGPSGPCSELYIDRGLSFGELDDLPGGENERFLEYWNLVFMQYDQDPHNQLSPLPTRNIDTGLGLNRLAAILQRKDSVFDTDQFQPLIDLGRELSGRSRPTTEDEDLRALRILADHSRGMSFLIADGVVPSNEDRGYVLRRLTRRAIVQARRLGMDPGFLVRYATVVRELMADAYPELHDQRAAIERWLSAEEDSFGRTLAQGTRLLDELVARARDESRTTISAADAFQLHDTYGFPFDLTLELLSEQGMGVDHPAEFERLMDEQRARSRAHAAQAGAGTGAEAAIELAAALDEGPPTRFTGYETELQPTSVVAIEEVPLGGPQRGGDAGAAEGGEDRAEDAVDGDARARARDGSDAGDRGGNEAGDRVRLLVKLAESPFYSAGGGQVSDGGVIECASGDCSARVENVIRVGQDWIPEVVLERGTLGKDEPVLARVDHAARRATERNHTATHLLHAALRERLGPHVRQAGSYVGPDKLRFDFTHAGALSAEELRDVEDAVNARVADGQPVRAITTTLDEARRLGAMALFGEKYGDVVRMVQIGDGSYSRELCGGTHVRNTAEIGPFVVTRETSSAANVRRIEALTGAAATELLRERHRRLDAIERAARAPAERLPELLTAITAATRTSLERVPELLARAQASAGSGPAGAGSAGAPAAQLDIAALARDARDVGDVPVLTADVPASDPKALLALADRLRGQLDGAVIVLGTAIDGRAHLLVAVAPELVPRGLHAGQIVKAAAALVGGGGGGRDTLAQAGGRDPERLDDALGAARRAIEEVLA
ncbi:MAG TPA: alanine--tRNA ligase [Solirubrobacteraceae bacterium]|nr:alanine--tRNA ligase [Solirubrobacteraceae bacterium]